MPTITGKHGFGVVEPYLVQIGQTGFTTDRSKDVREPLTTIVSKNEHCLIAPKLQMAGNGAGFPIDMTSHVRCAKNGTHTADMLASKIMGK